MSNYKVGDKVVLTVTSKVEEPGYSYYILNDDAVLLETTMNEEVEPLSAYTEPLEDTIQKYTVKIARLVMEKEELKDENKRLKAENEKMSVKIDAYELCGDQHEVEYNQAFNKGAEIAWELARKIVIQDGYSGYDLYEIFGSSDLQHVLENYIYPEAAAKVADWEKAKEEIKVGDVLEGIYDNTLKCVVTNLYTDNTAYLVFDDGSAGWHELDNFKKTGRHIDIDGFLKQIGGEK